MFSYTATVGRNFSPTHPLPGLQGKPMTLSAWGMFTQDVQAEMLRHIQAGQAEPVTMEVHYGKGEWDGVTEESAKITVLRNDYADADYLRELRQVLSFLAREYGQDTIALTVGTSELIGTANQGDDADVDDCPVCERVTCYDGEECTECGRLWGIDYSRADVEERLAGGVGRLPQSRI